MDGILLSIVEGGILAVIDAASRARTVHDYVLRLHKQTWLCFRLPDFFEHMYMYDRLVGSANNLLCYAW